MKYFARYVASDKSNPATVILDAADDTAAINKVNAIVEGGISNQAVCYVELSGGSKKYSAKNINGNAVQLRS